MATAPGGGSGDGSSGPNWLGLLKWSLKYQDGTQDSSEHAALSDEKRQFLEKAMQEAFVDVVKKMKDGIDELEAIAEAAAPAVTDGAPWSSDRAEEVWEELMEFTEDMDNALFFCQIGGLPTLFRYLQPTVSPALQATALSVLSSLTQNNPRVQEEVLRLNPLPLLVGIVMKADAEPRQLAKAVAALSCTIRGHHEAEEAFMTHAALDVFRRCLEGSDDLRVRQKALFFMQALVSADRATSQRAERLLPLLLPVVRGLGDEDLDVRTSAMGVVAAVSNLLGPSTLKEGDAGRVLEEVMGQRRAHIASLTGVDRAEAHEEELFWQTLEEGGVFTRDGQTVAPSSSPTAEAGEEGAAGQGEQAGAEEAAPILLLEPAKLTAASNAP